MTKIPMAPLTQADARMLYQKAVSLSAPLMPTVSELLLHHSKLRSQIDESDLGRRLFASLEIFQRLWHNPDVMMASFKDPWWDLHRAAVAAVNKAIQQSQQQQHNKTPEVVFVEKRSLAAAVSILWSSAWFHQPCVSTKEASTNKENRDHDSFDFDGILINKNDKVHDDSTQDEICDRPIGLDKLKGSACDMRPKLKNLEHYVLDFLSSSSSVSRNIPESHQQPRSCQNSLNATTSVSSRAGGFGPISEPGPIMQLASLRVTLICDCIVSKAAIDSTSFNDRTSAKQMDPRPNPRFENSLLSSVLDAINTMRQCVEVQAARSGAAHGERMSSFNDNSLVFHYGLIWSRVLQPVLALCVKVHTLGANISSQTRGNMQQQYCTMIVRFTTKLTALLVAACPLSVWALIVRAAAGAVQGKDSASPQQQQHIKLLSHMIQLVSHVVRVSLDSTMESVKTGVDHPNMQKLIDVLGGDTYDKANIAVLLRRALMSNGCGCPLTPSSAYLAAFTALMNPPSESELPTSAVNDSCRSETHLLPQVPGILLLTVVTHKSISLDEQSYVDHHVDVPADPRSLADVGARQSDDGYNVLTAMILLPSTKRGRPVAFYPALRLIIAKVIAVAHPWICCLSAAIINCRCVEVSCFELVALMSLSRLVLHNESASEEGRHESDVALIVRTSHALLMQPRMLTHDKSTRQAASNELVDSSSSFFAVRGILFHLLHLSVSPAAAVLDTRVPSDSPDQETETDDVLQRSLLLEYLSAIEKIHQYAHPGDIPPMKPNNSNNEQVRKVGLQNLHRSHRRENDVSKLFRPVEHPKGLVQRSHKEMRVPRAGKRITPPMTPYTTPDHSDAEDEKILGQKHLCRGCEVCSASGSNERIDAMPIIATAIFRDVCLDAANLCNVGVKLLLSLGQRDADSVVIMTVGITVAEIAAAHGAVGFAYTVLKTALSGRQNMKLSAGAHAVLFATAHLNILLLGIRAGDTTLLLPPSEMYEAKISPNALCQIAKPQIPISIMCFALSSPDACTPAIISIALLAFLAYCVIAEGAIGTALLNAGKKVLSPKESLLLGGVASPLKVASMVLQRMTNTSDCSDSFASEAVVKRIARQIPSAHAHVFSASLLELSSVSSPLSVQSSLPSKNYLLSHLTSVSLDTYPKYLYGCIRGQRKNFTNYRWRHTPHGAPRSCYWGGCAQDCQPSSARRPYVNALPPEYCFISMTPGWDGSMTITRVESGRPLLHYRYTLPQVGKNARVGSSLCRQSGSLCSSREGSTSFSHSSDHSVAVDCDVATVDALRSCQEELTNILQGARSHVDDTWSRIDSKTSFSQLTKSSLDVLRSESESQTHKEFDNREANSALECSTGTAVPISAEEKLSFWSSQRCFDGRIAAVVDALDTDVLGLVGQAILRGRPSDINVRQQIAALATEFCHDLKCHPQLGFRRELVDPPLMELLLLAAADRCNIQDATSTLLHMLSPQSNSVDGSKYESIAAEHRDIHSRCLAAVREVIDILCKASFGNAQWCYSRQHVLLCLDSSLHQLPWESCAPFCLRLITREASKVRQATAHETAADVWYTMRHSSDSVQVFDTSIFPYPVSRVPSLEFCEQHFIARTLHQQKANTASRKKGYFIVNPSGDMHKTAERLAPLLQHGRQPHGVDSHESRADVDAVDNKSRVTRDHDRSAWPVEWQGISGAQMDALETITSGVSDGYLPFQDMSALVLACHNDGSQLFPSHALVAIADGERDDVFHTKGVRSSSSGSYNSLLFALDALMGTRPSSSATNGNLATISVMPEVALMGCSSGRAKGPSFAHREHEPANAASDKRPTIVPDGTLGTPAFYLALGCPAVSACLWDVTDGDLDRLTVAAIKDWHRKLSSCARNTAKKVWDAHELSQHQMAYCTDNGQVSEPEETHDGDNSAPSLCASFRRAAYGVGHTCLGSAHRHKSRPQQPVCKLPFFTGASLVVFGVY